MPLAASQLPAGHDVIAMLGDAAGAVEALFADARRAVSDRVTIEGRPVARVFDREQRATHGLAWLATYMEAIRQLAAYTQRLSDAGSFHTITVGWMTSTLVSGIGSPTTDGLDVGWDTQDSLTPPSG